MHQIEEGMIFFMKDIYYKNTLYFCIFRHVSCLHFFSVTMSNEEEKEEEDAGLLEPGMPPQILADQLTLSQPEGADFAHHITNGTPYFQTFLRPCILLVSMKINSKC